MRDTASDIVKAIQAGQLDDSLDWIREASKKRRKAIGQKVGSKLAVGELITIVNSGSSWDGEVGTVSKVNRTRCIVTINGSSVNVPFTCVERTWSEAK